MKTRYIVAISVIATILILVGGLFLYNYELARNQLMYNNGYTQGLLYTQSSGGKMVYLDNSTGTPTLQETTLIEECNKIINQQGIN